MTTPAKSNGWLTPALLVTILIAVMSGGWFMVQQATGALSKRHESDMAAIYRLLNERHVTTNHSLEEIKEDLKELKRIILEKR